MHGAPQGAARSDSRRQHFRHPMEPLAYVRLGGDNGGIILNLGERGMAVQAVQPLEPGQTTHVRFQLPGSALRVDGTAQVAWSDSSGQVGMRFLHLERPPGDQLKEWMLFYRLAQCAALQAEAPDATLFSRSACFSGHTNGARYPGGDEPLAGSPASESEAEEDILGLDEPDAPPPSGAPAPQPKPAQSHGGSGDGPTLFAEDDSQGRRVAFLAIAVVAIAAALGGIVWQWTHPGDSANGTLAQEIAATGESAEAPPEAALTADPVEDAAQDATLAHESLLTEAAEAESRAAASAEPLPPLETFGAAQPATLTAIRRIALPEVTRVVLELDRPAPYAAERLRGPERLLVDLRGATLASAIGGERNTATLPVNDARVRRVRILQSGGDTRVVLDLECACPYTITLPPGAPPRIVIEVLPAH